MFLPQEIIRTKRDGHRLSATDMAAFVAGLADGRVGDAQAAAFAMAVFLRGLETAERVELTLAMARSGQLLDWAAAALPGPVLDKHSSGGVGDKVSLLLAPLVAACGGFVPMISGRGLGHTGGTLDKMDSIPGYRSQPELAELRRTVAAAGCAIVGATGEIAPADRRLYAIRDVTATVETPDLIVPSILSKKLAAGLRGLVMDVKVGNGAFLPERDRAESLARTIVEVAEGAGLPTVALLTDMGRVLGTTAGNALEVRECLDILRGGTPDPRLWQVTKALTAELLLLGGLAASFGDAEARVQAALDGGAAAERFARMVVALGGPADLLERADAHLPTAPVIRPVQAAQPGYVVGHDVRALGMAVIALGGGRIQPTDGIDHAVGLAQVAGPGTAVGPGDAPLCIVHARTEAAADTAEAAVRQAIHVDTAPPAPENPIAGRISLR